MSIPSVLRVLCLFPVGFLLFTSCASHSKWKMMPTPTVHQYLGDMAFKNVADAERSPSIEIFYATNRPPAVRNNNHYYENGAVDYLHVGKSTVHFGNRRMNWKQLLDLSTIRKRKGKVPIRLESAVELACLPAKGDRDFAREINRVLATRERNEITIYVHGAKSNFFTSNVQGAQFHHFMARNGAFIAFSWPSTGNLLAYDKDVRYAKESIPRFADLIEFLAAHTDAEKINILSYSAGAQVVTPALAMLRDRHPDTSTTTLHRKLRIGEVYLAAPDVSFKDFTNTYLPAFSEIVDNTTVSYHHRDGVLGWAIRATRESRLGRPDSSELDNEEVDFLIDAAENGRVDGIDMGYSPVKRPFDFKAHGNWYTNEWVSSDVILQFLFHERPSNRGLKRKEESPFWYFPADYGDTLEQLVEEALAEYRAGKADETP